MLKTIETSPILSWQESLSNLVTDPNELLQALSLKAEQIGLDKQACNDFPLRVPRPFLARMQVGNPNDPLLLQVLPHNQEHHQVEGFTNDPLGERLANPKPGILHKYNGRALLMPTSSCAIHCRYCFRRHFPYEQNRADKKQWAENLSYLSEDTAISEVILSGGDPLALSDKHLAWLIGELNNIKHVKRLRIHTRLPIMIPQRISSALCRILKDQRLQTVVVLHSNHAQEFDDEVDAACLRLKQSHVTLLNQSVLLKGINDSSNSLIQLSERLFKAGVLPYYLHLLDKVAGASHFEVESAQAFKLMRDIQARLPGYLLPKLVRERAGDSSKAIVDYSA